MFRRDTTIPAAALSDNPYTAARREWDDRYDRLARGRRNWQLCALLLLILDVFLTLALYHRLSTSSITPYVVEVDRHGHAVAFGPAEQLRKTDERLVRYELTNFIVALRTVYGPGNTAAQKLALDRASAYLRPPATTRVAEWFATNNPYAAERATVTVEVTSILRLEERANIWKIEWNEVRRGPDGVKQDFQPWQAIVQIAFSAPSKTDKILINPLGLYVTTLDWLTLPKEN